MGSLPSDCNEKFEVNASGKTAQEAKANALASANNICAKVLGKKCSVAEEVGSGKVETAADGTLIYFSTYTCPKKEKLEL